RALLGDLVAASIALESARAVAPAYAPAIMAWAEVKIDLGEPAAAAEALRVVVGRERGEARARLLLAEASRAAATRPDDADRMNLEAACVEEGGLSPAIAASCALGSAIQARLAGERG